MSMHMPPLKVVFVHVAQQQEAGLKFLLYYQKLCFFSLFEADKQKTVWFLTDPFSLLFSLGINFMT